jgi:cell division protease FtsH
VLKRGKERGRSWMGNGSLLIVILLLVTVGYLVVKRDPTPTQLKYGELRAVLTAAKHSPEIAIRNVHMTNADIRGEIVTTDLVSDGEQTTPRTHKEAFRAMRLSPENDAAMNDLLYEATGGDFQGPEDDSAVRNLTSGVFTFFLFGSLILLAVVGYRWLAGGNSPLTFGRSRHKLYAEKDLAVSFADVAGIDEAVAELREVVDFLKNPGKYQALGGRIPKGVLLVGPPGTGKTLLAKAVAGEAGAPFFSLSGSDFVEMFVGVGASRVRDLFAQAESRAPCIIFIDELDALGKTRTGGVSGGDGEREQTLNQLLVEMDGFRANSGVILMAATNRPETLDAALLRPGRFDRTVVVDRPDISGREAILKVHVRAVKLGDDVDLRRVAGLTPGSVGADLANLVNEACLMAARSSKTVVAMAEFNEAVERGAVGLERKSRIMHADEKQRVAYHEAGHALVACALPNTYPVHKVSIIPRGVGALGYVLSRPDEDRYLMTQGELESKIKVALGGTVAEELVYREISNGATSDLENASRIARSMVKQFGMSRLGRVCFGENSGSQFLAGSFGSEPQKDYSEHTAREIDMEVRGILEAATDEVRSILSARRSGLEAVARRLIETEVLDGGELRQILDLESPGPKLVPGTLPRDERVAIEPSPNGTAGLEVIAE